MSKATPLKRTSGITSRSTLNRKKTPYPLLDHHHQQRVPLTPLPNTVGPKEPNKRFLALEETDEEVEEPLEMRPPREATVKLEKKTPGRKRRNLVDHSSFPDLLGPTPIKQKKEELKRDESTPRPNRRSARTNKVFLPTSPAPQETLADSDISVVTPKKDIIFKVPLAPAKPKKTPPIRPPPKKRSSADKTTSGSIPGKQTVPNTPKAGETEGVISQIQDFGGLESLESGIGLFEPDGITRDIYVQGSKMIVKVKVQKAIYPDGSPSESSEEISAHIASTLQHFLVPFLHRLTFRHTGPMEAEHYVKDLPIMYHIRQEPHGGGNKFKRSKTETCWMWEETVIITPYLIQGSDQAVNA